MQNYRLDPSDIKKLSSIIFRDGRTNLDRSQFIKMVELFPESFSLIDYFHEAYMQSIIKFREKLLERLQVTQFIRKMLLEMQKHMYDAIKDIEETKLKMPKVEVVS